MGITRLRTACATGNRRSISRPSLHVNPPVIPAVNMIEAGLLPIFNFLAGFIQLNVIRIACESGISQQQNHLRYYRGASELIPRSLWIILRPIVFFFLFLWNSSTSRRVDHLREWNVPCLAEVGTRHDRSMIDRLIATNMSSPRLAMIWGSSEALGDPR